MSLLGLLHRLRGETEVAVSESADPTPVPPDGPDVDAAFVEILTTEDKNHRYDLQTAAIIRRVLGPGELAVDVGAHKGEILRWLIEASPDVAHIAVEPIPELAAGLKVEYPSAEVHQLALVSKPDGPISFHHVTSNPGYSGIRQREFDRPSEQVDMIDVSTARLDDLVGDRTVRLIKLDVEGAELGVLEGASNILHRDRPIVIFEHGLGAANVYGTEPGEIYELFSKHGLHVHLLATYLELGPPLSREQFVDQYQQSRNYYFVAAP